MADHRPRAAVRPAPVAGHLRPLHPRRGRRRVHHRPRRGPRPGQPRLRPRPPGASRAEPFLALAEAGWSTNHRPYVSTTQPPDRLALITHVNGRLDHQDEINDLRSRWVMGGGASGYSSEWLATFTTNTPVHLISATTARLADPAPVARYKDHLPERNRAASRITPVKPPVPSPLDIARAQAARSRSTTARAVIPTPVTVWRTTTPAPAAASARRR
ncbi:conserved hypothetical protein [Streptomyces clavuligerus]|nr:conserved hypothetical protein [Streptomyces clavuligerus]